MVDTSSANRLRAEIGARTQHLLTVLKVSQTKFAQAVGVSQTFVSGVSRGETLPSVQLLIGLREVYDVSLDWYLRGIGEPFSAEGVPYPVRTVIPDEVAILIPLLVELHKQDEGRTLSRVLGFVEGLSLARPERKRA